MSMRVSGLSAMAVCALAFTGVADAFDPTAATTLRMKKGDGSWTSSVTNIDNWVIASSGAYPNPKIAPNQPDAKISATPAAAAYDFYTGGYCFRTFKVGDGKTVPVVKYPDVITFGGRGLYVGESGAIQSGCTYNEFQFCVPNLHFLAGSRYMLNCSSGLTNSTITVESTAEKPWKIYNTNARDLTCYTLSLFDCTLKGDANAYMWIFSNAKALGNEYDMGPTELYFRGDGSGYYGTIRLATGDGAVDRTETLTLGGPIRLSGVSKDTTLENATVNVGTNGILKMANEGGTATVGTVNLSANGRIEPPTSGTLHIKNLNQTGGTVTSTTGLQIDRYETIDSGRTVVSVSDTALEIGTLKGAATLAYDFNTSALTMGSVKVTESFTGGALTLELPATISDNAKKFTEAKSYTLLRIAKTACATDLTTADFTVNCLDGTFPSLPTFSVTVTDDTENGTWNVVLTFRRVVYSTGEIAQTFNWKNNGTYFSDGKPANAANAADADYIFGNQFYSRGDFPMHAMLLAGKELWDNDVSAKFPEVTVFKDGSIVSSSGFDMTLLPNDSGTSRFVVPAGNRAKFRPYGGSARFVVKVPFSGEGTIQTLNRGKATPSGSVAQNFGGSSVCLAADNSAFKGGIYMTKYEPGLSYPYTLAQSTKLEFTAQNNLGGPLSAFRYDALHVSECGCLKPTASRVELNDTTRGVFFDGYALVYATNDAIFTITAPVSWCAEVQKLGAGLFRLGNASAPNFCTKVAATCGATGTNKLVVAEGSFGVTEANAANGLVVSFAAGTKLAVVASAGEGTDIRTYGLRNTEGSITFDDEQPKLMFTGWKRESGKVTTGILTVPTAAAAAFLDTEGKPKFAYDRIKGSRVTFASTEKDGNTTFTATIVPAGFSIILR